jgi:hypothetical protein
VERGAGKDCNMVSEAFNTRHPVNEQHESTARRPMARGFVVSSHNRAKYLGRLPPKG